MVRSLLEEVLSRGVDVNGEMHINSGKEFVALTNSFVALGGKFQNLIMHGHGINNTIFGGNHHTKATNGVYYGDRIQAWGSLPATRNGSASMQEINWEGAVNNNFTLMMLNCSGSDDAKAWLEYIARVNPQMTGGAALGRNYDGNWNGSSSGSIPIPSLKKVFLGQNSSDESLGYQIYIQKPDGTISNKELRHSADKYIPHEYPPEARTDKAFQASFYKYIKSIGADFVLSSELFGYLKRGTQ